MQPSTIHQYVVRVQWKCHQIQRQKHGDTLLYTFILHEENKLHGMYLCMLLESMPNHIKVINNNVIQDQISQISSTTSISLATLFS